MTDHPRFDIASINKHGQPVARDISTSPPNEWLPFRKFQPFATNDVEWFLVNIRQKALRINNQQIPSRAVAGPLPNFAVIEFDESAIFWWRDKNALDYQPVKGPQPRTKKPAKGKAKKANTRAHEDPIESKTKVAEAKTQAKVPEATRGKVS